MKPERSQDQRKIRYENCLGLPVNFWACQKPFFVRPTQNIPPPKAQTEFISANKFRGAGELLFDVEQKLEFKHWERLSKVDKLFVNIMTKPSVYGILHSHKIL